MTGTELHWKDSQTGQEITRSSAPSEQTLAMLEATVWGSRDTRYRILGIAGKLARLRDPSFFVLSENGIELCVFVVDHCYKWISGQRCGGYHFVMAATLEGRRDEGHATRILDVIRPHMEATVGRPGFGFAYVEESTEITLKLSEHTGHSIEAEIPLSLFYRLRPRPNDRVGKIRDEEREALVSALGKFYADHELTDFETSFRADETFVYRTDGKITASAQAELLNWSIDSMPGFLGRLLLQVLPKVPAWNRFLNLRDLKVVRFGNICFDDDAVAEFFALAGACLAQHRTRVGLIMLDRRSPVLKALKSSGDFGLLSRAMTGAAKIHVDTFSMDEDLMRALSEKPLLVSAADVF